MRRPWHPVKREEQSVSSSGGRKSKTPHCYAFGDVWKNTLPTSKQTESKTWRLKDTQDVPQSTESPPSTEHLSGLQSPGGSATPIDRSPAGLSTDTADASCHKNVHFDICSYNQQSSKGQYYNKGRSYNRQGSNGQYSNGRHYRGKKDDYRRENGGKAQSTGSFDGSERSGQERGKRRTRSDLSAGKSFHEHSDARKTPTTDWHSADSTGSSQRPQPDISRARSALTHECQRTEAHAAPAPPEPAVHPSLERSSRHRLHLQRVPQASETEQSLQTIYSGASLEERHDYASPSACLRAVEHLNPNGETRDRRDRLREISGALPRRADSAVSYDASIIIPVRRSMDFMGSWQVCFEEPELLPRGSQLVSNWESQVDAADPDDSATRLTIVRVSASDPNASPSERMWGTKLVPKPSIEEEEARKANYGLNVEKDSKLEKLIQDMRLRLGQVVVRPGDFEKPCQEFWSPSCEGDSLYHVRYRAEWFAKRPGLLGSTWYGHQVEDDLDQFRFYDRLLSLAENDPQWRMHAACCIKKFGGLVRLECEMRENSKREAKNLMLLQNFSTGHLHFRTVTLKIGAKTSIRGHRDVSFVQQWKDNLVSEATNSHIEGYRAEFVSHPSEALRDLMDSAAEMDHKSLKFRLLGLNTTRLQEMPFGSLLEYIFNFKEAGTELWKFSERFAHDSLVSWLRSIYHFCRSLENLSPPQKWINTHLTLGFDATSAEHRWKKTTIRSHNWQSSEITTEKEYQDLNQKSRDQHKMLWKQYCNSMYRVGWEIARYTVNRALSTTWRGCVFEIECFKDRNVHFCGILRNLRNKRQLLDLQWRCGGKKQEKKHIRMSVAVQEIDDDYCVTVIDIINLPSDIFPGNKFVIHCVAFAKEHDLEGYYIVAKGERMTMKVDGRAFSQASRTHILKPKVKDVVVQESFYFSRSCVDPAQLDFGDYHLFDQDFPPNLRFLPQEPLESTNAHFVQRFATLAGNTVSPTISPDAI